MRYLRTWLRPVRGPGSTESRFDYSLFKYLGMCPVESLQVERDRKAGPPVKATRLPKATEYGIDYSRSECCLTYNEKLPILRSSKSVFLSTQLLFEIVHAFENYLTLTYRKYTTRKSTRRLIQIARPMVSLYLQRNKMFKVGGVGLLHVSEASTLDQGASMPISSS